LYQKEHCHISLEAIGGTQPQSIKSDVYSVGVVIGNSYYVCKYKPIKEIAKQCLGPFAGKVYLLMDIIDSLK
jgi:hypothetical protein